MIFTCSFVCSKEVVFYTFLSKDEISYKSGVATQSHTFEASPIETYVASNAVDRNPATCMRSLAIGLTTEIQTVWWKLDLGDVFNIYSVSIWFRNDAIYGMFLQMKSMNSIFKVLRNRNTTLF